MKTCPQCQLSYPNDSVYCFVDGATLTAAQDPRIGSTIAGRYVMEEALGVGGMATVYRARHKLVERPCAIKLLNPQFAQDPTLRERFRREAKHAQRIAHPNIIEIFDQGDTDDGVPFLVMELLEGKSLADVIEHARLPIPRAVIIAIGMAKALARAHDFDVIHRDLKPENVFVLEGDQVKLLDFGIARCLQDARLTNLGEVFGTPQYMAPERGTSIDSGPAADLYALGVMLFEMIAGQLPFDAKDPATWITKHMKETPPRLATIVPETPRALDDLVFQLMAKKPQDRPVDAHAVAAMLTSIAKDLGVEPPTSLETLPPASTTRTMARPVDAWSRRTELFERMLGRGFGQHPPADLAKMLDVLKSNIREIGTLRTQALEEQQRLEQIENEGREGRLRLGRAMDALTSDASKTREDARSLRASVAPLTAACKAFPAELKAAHKEAMLWEGRSAFAEPFKELASAYERLAEIVRRWHEARKRELEAEAAAADKERAISDVDYQIRELRSSLAQLDRSVEEKRAASQAHIVEMGRRVEQLEAELIHLASRFCAPLRAKPELGPLFVELEKDAARASP